MHTDTSARERHQATVRSSLAIVLAVALIASLLTATGGRAEAVTDESPDFEVIASDLEFILKQIQISENHAAGGELLCASTQDMSGTCVPDPRLPWGVRTVDGSYNNISTPSRSHFGAADQDFPRLLPIHLRAGEDVPEGAPSVPGQPTNPTHYDQTNGFVYDSHPRLISNLIVDQTTNNPAAVAVAEKVEGSVIEDVETGPDILTWTRIEEDDEALAYSSQTFPVVSTPELLALRSGGAAWYFEEPGSWVEFTVTDGFRWIGNTSLGRGIAEVQIEGETVATVDQYGPTDTPGIVHYEVDDLGPTPKTVRIVNTGEMNPAAVVARTEIDAIELLSITAGEPGTPGRIFVPNESPDEGLSAPFNTWFIFFGQFFDHGLDLVDKGGSGTVVIPLREDDPLFDPESNTNFLMLTRATNKPDGTRNHNNRTTPFVDQNQTYTSHPSHQVFLREYDADGDATGHLLDAPGGGLATWADVKAQAQEVLGVQLVDTDVLNVPLLMTDPYGNFIPGPNGFVQFALEGGDYVEATGGPVPSNALRANHAFLDDIAHAAVPNAAGTHDGALLDAHFITGDGRGNENIGLTAVHHVFHAEHNRLVGHIEDVLNDPDNAELKERYETESTGGVEPWSYGQRLFQTARFVTEMEYQHLVFEEFARFVQPAIDEAPFNESAYHTDLDAAIVAEFAHVVYRFGHSQLTETIHREGFGTEDISLLDGFLNPHEFTMNGDLTPEQAAGSIVNGTVREAGSGIDEFVTETLRNELLGLPLDLATINLARGRDTGVPSLQTAREVFYAATGDIELRPYTSWTDFGLHMKHPESLANFVAAYGKHDDLDRSTMTITELREAAEEIVEVDAEFMDAAAADTGVDDIDFWVGGLAESLIPFGGMLGPTFNYVFERQLENLQNGDRFYYLGRNIGLNLFHQLEANSFSAIIQRTTDATHVPAEVFTTPDLFFLADDPPEDAAELGFVTTCVANAGDTTDYTNRWRYTGEDHVSMHGGAGNDCLRGGIGDDDIWGYAGDDFLMGGAGDNSIVGGPGRDIIYGLSGDDNLKGGAGNDAIHGGPGEDLILGGSGKDFIVHGSDRTHSFAGLGDDFVLGGPGTDIITGNEGDDWLEGGPGADLVQGDNANGFQDDPNGGHDVLIGGPGNDDLDAEGGDDIMVSSAGTDRFEGMLGFDWVTHKGQALGANADMDNTVFQPPSVGNFRDRYDLVEAVSGWDHDDVLRGVGQNDENDGVGHELTVEQLDRVLNLRTLLGGPDAPYAAPFMTANTTNNIILGGGGSDILEGRGGDDFIDGSAWLDVYLVWRPGGGAVVERQDRLQPFLTRVFNRTIDPGDLHIVREIVLDGDGPDDINTAVFSDDYANYVITPNADGTLQVAHLVSLEAAPDPDGGTIGDGVDVLRNVHRLEFADQVIDLTDTNSPAQGQPVILDHETGEAVGTPQQGRTLRADISGVTDADGIDLNTVQYEWQVESEESTTEAEVWGPAANGELDTFTPSIDEVGRRLRVVVVFNDNAGVLESVTSDPTAPVAPDGQPVPVAEVSPEEISFGQVTVGQTSAPQVVTVSNTGDGSLVVSDVSLSDPTASFAITANTCSTVAAGDSCTVSVTFAPTAVGDRFADLLITHNAAGSPSTVELGGSGVAAPVASTLQIQGGTNFGNRNVGQAREQSVRLRNQGPGQVTIASITVTGSESFSLASHDCPATLPVQGRCDVVVRFAPQAVGPHSATLTVTSNAANSPTTVSLTGSGR